MKRLSAWNWVCIISLIAVLISGFLYWQTGKSVDIIQDSEIKTGLQNNSLGLDAKRDIFFVGTYNNKLMAFQNKTHEKLWELEAKGPFCKLVVRSEQGLLYAGNSDNNVYIIQIDSGEVVNQINVKRRIYDIDVTRDGEEILISAGAAANKHNLFLYTKDGEGIVNLPYKSIIRGVSYTKDEQEIIFGNDRGEFTRIDKAGNVVGMTELQYRIVGVAKMGEDFAALCNDGSYCVLDEQLKLLRRGNVQSNLKVKVASIGADESGEYLVIGTEEGYLYVIDPDGNKAVSVRLSNAVAGILGVDDLIYITGRGDFIKTISVSDLGQMNLYHIIHSITRITGAVSFALLLISLMMSIPVVKGKLFKMGKALYKYRIAYLLLIPTFILLILFNYTPVFLAFTRAFTNWSKDINTLAEIKFVGLDNFKTMFSEGYFLIGIKNLVILMVTGFIKVLTVPILVAWLVYSMRSDRQKYIFRFLFVLPMVVPGIVSSLVWKQIYDPNIGLVNEVLGKIGLSSLQMTWLGDEKTALWAIIFMGFPFINTLAFLVYYGGLIDVDSSLIEAARVDGATRRGIFFRVLLPMIAPQIKMMIVLTFIGVVQDYANIYILTGGGPGTSTYVPGLELYYNVTKFGRYGYACALGLVMFVFILIGTIINMRIKSNNNE